MLMDLSIRSSDDENKKIPIGRSLRFDENHNIISDSNYKMVSWMGNG